MATQGIKTAVSPKSDNLGELKKRIIEAPTSLKLLSLLILKTNGNSDFPIEGTKEYPLPYTFKGGLIQVVDLVNGAFNTANLRMYAINQQSEQIIESLSEILSLVMKDLDPADLTLFVDDYKISIQEGTHICTESIHEIVQKFDEVSKYLSAFQVCKTNS